MKQSLKCIIKSSGQHIEYFQYERKQKHVLLVVCLWKLYLFKMKESTYMLFCHGMEIL